MELCDIPEALIQKRTLLELALGQIVELGYDAKPEDFERAWQLRTEYDLDVRQWISHMADRGKLCERGCGKQKHVGQACGW